MNIRSLLQLRTDQRGGTLILFALTMTVLMGSVSAAIDYSRGVSSKMQLQISTDSTALQLIRSASTKTSAQLTADGLKIFNGSFSRDKLTDIQVNTVYDTNAKTLQVQASGNYSTMMPWIFGLDRVTVSSASKAKLVPIKLPVCVLITSPNQDHTFLVKNSSSVDFSQCMTQVNTANWDAVEARDTSYIHSRNGQNCFVGDIHYGDVQPPKASSCSLLDDPFASFTPPAAASTCTVTNSDTMPSALKPGTYCNGLTIKVDTYFAPGLYVIKDGPFKVTGSASIQAKGVTFVLVGKSIGLDINTTGTINVTPASQASAGSFAGFSFFAFDPDTAKAGPSGPGGAGPGNKGPSSTIVNAKMNLSGILYLEDQALTFQKAQVTINPGTIVAYSVLLDGSALNLTSTLDTTTSAEQAMQKVGDVNNGQPTLMR